MRTDTPDTTDPTLPQPCPTTPRLHLREFVPDDAADVQRLAGDARIAATIGDIPHPYEAGMAEAWIGTHAAARAAGERLTWAVETRADGTLVGCIALHVLARHRRGTLGYWIGVPYWGRGYASEAAAAVRDIAFDVLALHRLQAEHLSGNGASGRVMVKTGLRHEGTLRAHVRHGARFVDMERYGMVRTDRLAGG